MEVDAHNTWGSFTSLMEVDALNTRGSLTSTLHGPT